MKIAARTQVGIIGAGPSGLLLARLLTQRGIDVVVLERRSRDYVEGRIRAGVLEQGSAAVLDSAGAAERMRTDGVEHDGVQIAFDGRIERIDFKDLYQLNRLDDISIHYEVQASGVTGLDEGAARIHYQEAGRKLELVCDFVAGCDGYHGVSRQSIPADVLRTYEKTYPFGWLGVLSNTRPASPELIYTNHERGFALCSQRSATVSRNYIQVATDDSVETWSDTAFWDELRRRVPAEVADTLQTGPSIEKSIAPLRSFIAEPLRYGRLFLVGDSGHIVPPTGAKGLNLAVSDTAMLASALKAYYADGDAQGIDRYSTVALKRVWQAQRFSWWFTMATHRLADSVFDQRMQIVDLDYFTGTEAGRTSIAENYVGLPIEDPVTGHSLP
jgi:p-hydroxybenzoate 3-monooxygenase